MKKHNEGYALPFVLVVFLIISLVATSVLTVSLRNLQSQKASIQRMEEQYVAQGEVEKIYASINALIQTNEAEKIEEIQISQAIIGEALKVVDEKDTTAKLITDTGWAQSEGTENVSFSISMTRGSYQIVFTIKIKGTVSRDSEDYYSISSPTVMYDSYTIEVIEAAASTESTGGDT